MDILLVACGVAGISILDYFCMKLWFDSRALRKVRCAQAGPGVLTVKIGLEVGPFSLICQMLAAFRNC